MKLRVVVLAIGIGLMALAIGCRKNAGDPSVPPSGVTAPAVSKTAGPLPDSGFKAQITFADGPLKLRAGQKENITVKVKNTSNVIWWQRGGETNDRPDNKFYIAVGNRWLDKDGKPTSETEGHNGIIKDLKPGEEIDMPLQITAPKEPGDYTLDLDLVQEGVAWFGEKGSPTTKVKVSVVK
jgi:hypothetical protein